MNRNLFTCFLLTAVTCTLFLRASSTGERPNAFKSQARPIETYSSRYDMPTNDPSLIGKVPFTFGYRFTDDYGTLQTREEKTDPNGSKTGSYSFIDAGGTYRQVDYIADSDGFRATVKTNEPGTLPAEPADVTIHVEKEKPYQRNVRHSPPQLEYSNHIFSRYNFSSNNYGQRTNQPANPLQGGHNQPFYDEDSYFRENPPANPNNNNNGYSNHANYYNGPQYPPGQPSTEQQLFPQNNQGYVNNVNYYNVPQYPVNQPSIGHQLNPQNDQGYSNNVNYYQGPQYPIRQPLRNAITPEAGLNSPVGYPKVPGLNPEEFFNDPNLNPGYVFGDKIADSGYDNKPEYSLLPPTPSSPYPTRHRNYRPRPKQSRNQYKIHTPKGFENHPDLPLYMDK